METYGIIWNQAAEFLGVTCNDNPEYQKFCQTIFGTIKESNTSHNGEFNGHKLSFNTECVPRHSGHVKSLLIDSKLLKIIGQRGASKNICMFCAAWTTK